MPVLPRALFADLFDDAAVFPPGNSPLDAAVAGHRRLRRSPYADLVGPLLLPPASVAAAADLAGLADLTPAPPGGAVEPEDADPGPLDVAIAARPDADLVELGAAVRAAARDDRLELRGVELGWFENWRELQIDSPAIVLELPRGTEQSLALTDLATAIAEGEPGNSRIIAKFRTGRTPLWDWPPERELARVIQSAIAMDVPLKLTGGLHHAVRSTLSDGEHHGVLNILTVVADARAGRPLAELTATLARREPGPLVDRLATLTAAQVTRLRAAFSAYGCCDVLEPIHELTELGVLEGVS
ncbi:MAG: hypothetical protein U0Q10_12215 [Dermatophilaceae bacterium]